MKILILFVYALFIASCSSINSIVEPNNADVDGLTYYMPKKDFVVTVNVISK